MSNDQSETFKKFSSRERILAAALKLFVNQGYFNTNVPDLGRESQCSVGSIYHSFKNKEEIARTLYEEALGAFRHAIETSVSSVKGDDVEKTVKTLITSLLSFAEVNIQLSKYIWLCRHDEFMTGMISHPTRVGYDKLGRRLTIVFKSAMREKKIRPLKANILWTILFGVPTSYIRDWLDGYNQDPPNKVAPNLAEVCWQAIKTH